MLIGPVEVERLPVTSELYRNCSVYIPVITIRMTDGIYMKYHGCDDILSVLMNLAKVAVCGSGG
jgi:hypothetical protein